MYPPFKFPWARKEIVVAMVMLGAPLVAMQEWKGLIFDGALRKVTLVAATVAECEGEYVEVVVLAPLVAKVRGEQEVRIWLLAGFSC